MTDLKQLEAVLAKRQWKRSWDGTVVYCPICGRRKSDGHAEDCVFTALQTAIRELREAREIISTVEKANAVAVACQEIGAWHEGSEQGKRIADWLARIGGESDD